MQKKIMEENKENYYELTMQNNYRTLNQSLWANFGSKSCVLQIFDPRAPSGGPQKLS